MWRNLRQILLKCTPINDKSVSDEITFGQAPNGRHPNQLRPCQQIVNTSPVWKIKTLYFVSYHRRVTGSRFINRIPCCSMAWCSYTLSHFYIGQYEYSNSVFVVGVTSLCASGLCPYPLLSNLVPEALSREFRTGVPWELLYADVLMTWCWSQTHRRSIFPSSGRGRLAW